MLYEEFLETAKKHESAADDFATISEYAKALQIKAVLQLAQVEHMINQDPHSLKAAFTAGKAAGEMDVAAQLLHHFSTELSSQELAYCENDCLVLKRAIDTMDRYRGAWRMFRRSQKPRSARH